MQLEATASPCDPVSPTAGSDGQDDEHDDDFFHHMISETAESFIIGDKSNGLENHNNNNINFIDSIKSGKLLKCKPYI